MKVPDWGLVFSFCIDNGELDGMTPQQCFVLGFELAGFYEDCEAKRPVNRICHAANADRLRRLFEQFERPIELAWMPNDPGEEWMQCSSPITDEAGP